MPERDVVVFGSTGTQGGAVTRALVHEESFTVHAVTRDGSKPEAQQLEELGANVVEANLAEPDTLPDVLEGKDAVFGVTNFWEHGEEEVEHGINLAEACEEAGIEHLVFSSVGGAERDTGITHFDTKWEIEQRIDELGIPATIVRPVWFMQNLEGMRETILEGTMAMGLHRGVSLQMLDIENLGDFVRVVLLSPDVFLGESYELASDELTLQAAAARIADVTGRPIRAQNLSIDEVRESAGEEYAVMFQWFNEHGYESDITGLRADHDVAWTRLETYLEREGWGKVAD